MKIEFENEFKNNTTEAYTTSVRINHFNSAAGENIIIHEKPYGFEIEGAGRVDFDNGNIQIKLEEDK